jgi:type I restriction enzyme S subunit
MKVKLGDLTKIRTGKLDANASSEDGRYPFFTCSREPLRIATYSYDCECVLVAGNGDLNVKYYNGKFDAYQRTYIIEDNGSGKLYMPYLYYFMDGYMEELRKQAIGGVIKYIKLGNLTDALIALPDIETQKEIVNILETSKSIVESRKREIQILDGLIKARFDELFGDLMENPLGWPVMTIADVSTFLKSGLSRKLSDDDIGLPVIRSGNIQDGQFIFDDVKYWYIDDPQGANTKDYILNDGDVLVNFINSSSQIGKTAIYRDTGRDCIYTTNIFRMKLADNCNEYYYNWFAMSDYYYRHLQSIIQPAVNQASFTTVNFLKLPIPLPPKEKQGKFADFVKQVDKSKVAVQKSLDETQLLFNSLMQKYFG